MKMQSIKYNNFINYEWKSTLIEKNDNYIITRGEVNRRLIHHGKNKTFTFENISIEFYTLEEWFTLSIERTTDNKLNYYCNICMPVKVSNDTISFIDLDLDIVKVYGEDWKVVDEDEFEINSKKYNYPLWLINRTIEEKDKLLEKIKSHTFPFNGEIESRLMNF